MSGQSQRKKLDEETLQKIREEEQKERKYLVGFAITIAGLFVLAAILLMTAFLLDLGSPKTPPPAPPAIETSGSAEPLSHGHQSSSAFERSLVRRNAITNHE